jgi:hypothetical protein
VLSDTHLPTAAPLLFPPETDPVTTPLGGGNPLVLFAGVLTGITTAAAGPGELSGAVALPGLGPGLGPGELAVGLGEAVLFPAPSPPVSVLFAAGVGLILGKGLGRALGKGLGKGLGWASAAVLLPAAAAGLAKGLGEGLWGVGEGLLLLETFVPLGLGLGLRVLALAAGLLALAAGLLALAAGAGLASSVNGGETSGANVL